MLLEIFLEGGIYFEVNIDINQFECMVEFDLRLCIDVVLWGIGISILEVVVWIEMGVLNVVFEY